jgi:hypothetical protein
MLLFEPNALLSIRPVAISMMDSKEFIADPTVAKLSLMVILDAAIESVPLRVVNEIAIFRLFLLFQVF